MRARTLTLLLVALLLAGGTALLARAWLNAQQQATAEAAPVALPPPVKSVLVANGPVQRGQILKSADLAWQPWPEGGIDKSYILLGTRTPESLAGAVARNPLASGEPVTDEKVVAPGSRGFLAAVLQPGMRAVSVPVTATSGISGFVFPGDRVDILIPHSIPSFGDTAAGGKGNPFEHKAVQTVLRDIRVIGIDQRLEGKTGEALIAHTATLEVTSKQSEIIALASEMGKLSLSLRSLAYHESEKPIADQTMSPDSRGGDMEASFTLDSEVSPLLPKPLTGKETPQTGLVTILRGGGKAGDSSGPQPAPRGS